VKPSDRLRVEFLEERKMICRRTGLDSKKVEGFHSKIVALLEKGPKKDRMGEMFEEFFDNMASVFHSLEEFMELTTARIIPKRTRLLVELFYYLGLSEGLLSQLVQSIALILMESGHDIYDPQRMKFVKNYRNLDKVSLFVKLQFIEAHGFKYLTKLYDRKLRNCVAHLRFNLNDDGTITNKITGEKIEEKVLLQQIGELTGMGMLIFLTYREALEVQAREIEQRRV